MVKQEIINQIKNKQLPVIISGAGIVGKALLSLCMDEGIEVECFCDSSIKAVQSDFCGLEVIYTPDLKNRYKDAVIIISVAAIKDVVDLLHNTGFKNWYAGGVLLKDLDVSQDGPDASIDYSKFAIENCILCHDGYMNPDKLFLRSIDLIITERCSLKCRDCSNLMQYYENPKNCDTDKLLKSIDAFCSVIDEVMDFRVIGGDAFMNKEWPVIVSRLTNELKAKRVVLYTNGTIIPNEKYVSILNNSKVLIIITDYGILSKKIHGLKKVLEENSIAYHVLKPDEWLDCAVIAPHNRTLEENKQLYKICCAKNMNTLSDGKLFRCPYSANAARLSAVPDYKNDYMDLFTELNNVSDVEGIRAIKNKVRDFVINKNYLDTCDYCNGRPLAGNAVKPAVQAAKPVVYHKYAHETGFHKGGRK